MIKDTVCKITFLAYTVVFLSLFFISFSLYEISCNPTYTGGDYLYTSCAWNFVYLPLISVY